MQNIEDFSKKFNKIKTKLEITSINDLTTNNFKSILSILNNNRENLLSQNQKKEKKSIKQFNLINPENNPNSKIKDKNIFFTQKYREQNIFTTNNISKEKSPKNPSKKNNLNESHNIDSINQIKINNIIKQQNDSINNSKINNNSMTNNNISANVNLIVLENGELNYNEVSKIFQKDEEKKNLEEKNKKIEENVEGEGEGEGDIDDDSSIYDEEIGKKKTAKKDDTNNNDNYLIINKKESMINLSKNFNIFDEHKMMIGEEDILTNLNDNNEFDDYNNNETNNKQNELNAINNNSEKTPIYEEPKKNKNTKSKLNKDKNNKDREKEKNRHKINSKNNKNNKLEKIEKNLEMQQNNDNKNNDNDNYNNSNKLSKENNNLKISIMIDEEGINDGLKENSKEDKYEKEKKSQITPIKHNEERHKEKENHQNPIKKKNIKSKSCYNPISSNISISNKINKKVITDEEEEENIDFNNQEKGKEPQLNNTNTNYLYLSSSKSTKDKSIINNINDTDIKVPVVINDGNKFTLFLESDINTNNNIINNMTKQNTNKEKDKNKHKDNYDLECINKLCKILEQIENKLKKDNNDEKIDNKCYEMIQKIKSNNTDFYRRKRNTYLCILKILELLFRLLSPNKKIKFYLSDILKSSDIIHEYFKNIKKYDSSIIEIPHFYKKKIAFKYIYSSLELKAYDINALKELTKKNNSNAENTYNDLVKFAKIYKRHKKSSEFLIKEFKDFKEKINKYKAKSNSEYLNKYDHYLTNIQTMPNFMNYMKLLEHFIIVLNFFNDLKKFKEEIEKKNGLIDNKRDRSVKVKNEYDSKNKNRERSRYKEIEKEGKK